MKALLGLDLMVLPLVYGYALAAQPQYATAGGRWVAEWTHRQPFLDRCAIAFTVWLVFMSGLYLFVRGMR